MMSSILTHVLQLLSIFTLLQLQCIDTEAHPITSEPIEWNAENWVVQLGLAKQTSEEQIKGKGRKVTPKSIFENTYRNNCPPDHHAEGSLCILTVKVDPAELIERQILAIGNFASKITNVEYDYGEEIGSTKDNGQGVDAYDEQLVFSGGSLSLPTSIDNAGQPTSQDAPFRINLMEQKLSVNENDTMQDGMSYDEEYNMPAKPNNVTTSSSLNEKNNTEILSNGFLGLFLENNQTMDNNFNNSMNFLNENSTIAIITSPNSDLITESSNISTSMAAINKGSVITLELPTATKDFPINNIDAISLTASVPVRHLTGTIIQEENIENNTPTTHEVSLHKGDSVVQLITTTSLIKEHETQSTNEDQEVSELLKSDGFLPIFKGALFSSPSLSSDQNTNTSKETTYMQLTKYDEKAPPQLLHKETTTTIAAPQEYEIFDSEKDSWKPKEKSDHTRSVTESFLMSEDDLSAQEKEFTTTMEPDGTTSFQLDDTTIIEEFNPPTIKSQELQVKPASGIKLEEHMLRENIAGDVEKSKVQPVFETTTTTTTEISSIPLPIAALPDSHQIDSGIIIDGDINIGDSEVDVTENQFNYGKLSATTTLDNSHEMPSEPEAISGNIYDLVKGANNDINNSRSNVQETTSITENNAIVQNKISETDVETETSSTYSEEELSNFEMETTTISSDTKYNNNNVNKINKAQQALVTNADVNVNNNKNNNNNNDDDVGEIVFVVKSHNSNNRKRQFYDNIATTTTVESGDESYTNENIETASTTTTTERITSKRWSKVMPIFDKNTNPPTTEQLVDENTFKIHDIIMVENEMPTTLKKSIKQSKESTTTTTTTEFLKTSTPITTIAPITEIVTTKSSSISISEKHHKNGSRRNSKIIRLDKYPLAASVNRLSEVSKMILPPSPISSATTIYPTTIKTSDMNAIDTKSRSRSSSSSSSNLSNSERSDLFWWLPMGWHLDRHENFEGHPLLLRLWTTLTSNNQAKV